MPLLFFSLSSDFHIHTAVVSYIFSTANYRLKHRLRSDGEAIAEPDGRKTRTSKASSTATSTLRDRQNFHEALFPWEKPKPAFLSDTNCPGRRDQSDFAG
ncbi:hypothetical protein ACC771_09355, partial [Rhizobium ruizarguesonis]